MLSGRVAPRHAGRAGRSLAGALACLAISTIVASASCGKPGEKPGFVSRDWYSCGPAGLFPCWQNNYACCPNSREENGVCRLIPVCDATCQADKIVSILGKVPEEWLHTYGAEKPGGGPLYGTKVWRDQMGRVDSIRIDVAGEGEHLCTIDGKSERVGHADTVNLNGWNKVTCDGPDFGRTVPNFVAGDAARMPFHDAFADVLYIENGPTTSAIGREFARVLRDDGTINVVGPDDASLVDWARTVTGYVKGTITSQRVENGYLHITIKAGTHHHDEL